MTPLRWVLEEMPKLEKRHRPLLLVVHPGEVLWVPQNWLHLTVNIDDALYVVRAACEDQMARHESRKRARAAVRRICNATDRFCQGYCHSFCTSCDERNVKCK